MNTDISDFVSYFEELDHVLAVALNHPQSCPQRLL